MSDRALPNSRGCRETGGRLAPWRDRHDPEAAGLAGGRDGVGGTAWEGRLPAVSGSRVRRGEPEVQGEMTDALLLPAEERQDLWQRLIEAIERDLRGLGEGPVAPPTNAAAPRQLLARRGFSAPA